MIAVAAVLALAASTFGLLLSYHADLPSGPAIILTAGAFYAFALLFGRHGSLLERLRRPVHLEA
jgi:zinc/manganese transport system permease protein